MYYLLPVICIVLVGVVFCSCKGSNLTAKVTYNTVYNNDMALVNGRPVPPTVSDKKVFKVKRGDKISQTIVVESVTKNNIKLRFTFGQFYESTTQTEGTKFTLKRGAAYRFSDMMILDASHTINITVE